MQEDYKKVGERIRRERLKYGLTLSEAAKAIGLSASFLSLLENGKVVPSLKSLSKICSFFSLHIATLFEEDDNSHDVLFFPSEKQVEISMKGDRSLKFLLPKKGVLEPVLITLFPRSIHQEFTVHEGMEFGYVLRGEIEVQIRERDPVRCKAGDSILYRADLPHRLVNPTDYPSEGLWIGFRGVDFPGKENPVSYKKSFSLRGEKREESDKRS